jgi:hypothetical protein
VGVLTDATNLNGAGSVAVTENYALMASYDADSLSAVDVADKTSPRLVGVLTDATNHNAARDVAVTGNYALAASSSANSLSVIDLTDKTTEHVIA